MKICSKNSSKTTNSFDDNKLPLSVLTKVYEVVGQTRGQNSKNLQKGLLANMFKQLVRRSIDDLVRGYWISILKCGPEYEKNQLYIGREILVKSIANSCGMTEKQVREASVKTGDLGEVAQTFKSTQKTMDSFFSKKKEKEPLTIEKFFNSLRKISQTKGNNSNAQKQNILVNLLIQSANQQAKYIVRWIQKNLKIAAAQKTMQKALVTALFEEFFPHKDQTQQNFIQYQLCIKKSIAEYPNEQKVIRKLVQIKNKYHKINEQCKLTLGIPCKPMLAKPTRGLQDILTRFDGKKFTCEYKYDGLRGQVHYDNGKISIFSRNLQNITQAYIDLVESIKQSMKGNENHLQSFILDCQIVAINKATRQLLPFQILATRSRKNTNINEIQVFVNMFAFDILYYNEPITHLPLKQRRTYLNKLLPIFSDILRLSEHTEHEDLQSIDDFFKQALKFGTEGLMIKDLDSEYTCSKRSWDWVKLKKDYIDGVGDTLDLVPIGAFYGTGKRKGVYGSYLLAVYNQDMEVYETICKIGTGFSDEVLQSAYQFFKDKQTQFKSNQYKISNSGEEPDIWFIPCAVWQVKGADFQLSPVHTCGIGLADPNRGIGLRFPRLIGVREDKKPQDASTNQFVLDLYKNQDIIKNQVKEQQEEDFY